MTIRYEELINLAIPDRDYCYTERDAMLYALGTGFGADPMDSDELPFVYERGLKASPTLATVIAWDRSWIGCSKLNWPLVVHGDQRLTIHRAIRSHGAIVSSARVSEILDKGKGKGLLVRVETTVRDKRTGVSLWTMSSGFFARGDGGIDRVPAQGSSVHLIPDRDADTVIEAHTQPNQALIYRLSGDMNPLHAVPQVAAQAGFSRPLLHGLCTYGFACRAVLRAYCKFQPERLKVFNARFSAPLFPGESMRIELWKDAEIVSFRVRCADDNRTVLDNGRAELT